MNSPLISVILPTYNRQLLLAEAVESILNQTLSDFELIIINDGSADKTDEWVKSQTDQRIKYISYSENKGVSFARNKGLDAAQGKYIAFADSDDLNEKTRFAEQVAVLEADENLAVCGCDIQFFEDSNLLLKYRAAGHLPFRMKALFGTPFHFPAAMVRRDFLEKEKIRFRPEVRSADDYYFLMKIVAKGEATVVPKVLYQYRWHDASISALKKGEQAANELAINRLAYQEILGLTLTEKEAKIIYQFYRKKSLLHEEKAVWQVIEKIITAVKNQPKTMTLEKQELITFLKEKHRQYFKKTPKSLLLFLYKSLFQKR